MSTNAVDAPARGFAGRWPFRRKLNVLVGVPLAVVAVLLAYLIADQVGQSQSAKSAAQLVRDSAQVATLVDRVENEHQQAILLSVRHEAGTGAKPSLTAYRKAQARVDAQVEKVRTAFGSRLPDTEAQALKEVNGLGSLRDTIEDSYLPASNIDPAYTDASKGLIDGLGLDRNETLAATFTGNLLDSLLRADAAHASFETSVFSATTGDTNALIEYTNAIGSYDLYSYQADRFTRFASEEQADSISGIEHSTPMRDIAEAYAELQVDPSGLQKNTPAKIQAAFKDAMGDYPAYPEQAASRLEITTALVGEIADRADDASSSAQWRAGLLLNLALTGFALWIAFAVVVRRSVVRPVQALTGAAREVAEVAGRELARVADDDAESEGPPRLREMPVTADDEIGELAEAFNHVQTTAAALLERQVLSRRNVAEMFGNVGRRVSNLTTRQLALIDAVERGETDPELLERLYSIDHIAVRLRRNADSLMLLAGIRETVLASGPTALTNVVRAALGQIEGYQRVQLHAGANEAVVEPDVIGDLTLMVAELLENAVSFSPVGSPVEVLVRSAEDGTFIVITDHGLGMSAERLAEENARLIRRERLDVVPTKVLGLFVVGALARRWDITVTLSRSPGGGVTAEVALPSSLLLTMSAVEAAGTVRRPAGEAQAAGTVLAPATAPGLTAARSSAVVPAPRQASEPTTAAASGSESGSDSGSGSGSERADGSGATARYTAASEDTAASAAAEHTAAPASGEHAGAASGPLPSSALPPVSDTDVHGLPRRVPRRETAAGDDGAAPLIPHARTEAAAVPEHGRTDATNPTRGDDAESATGDGTRPLRRRVRGATLRPAAGAGDRQPDREAPRPADADAVRDALDEFEAAVARAREDSATLETARPAPDPHGSPDPLPPQDRTRVHPPQDVNHPHPPQEKNHPHHQNHLPEGAEQ
ncbi:ATP-binding protein [Streptomyces mangrovisoli]|uniref:ATP-binding protein n=1 Tax=Streptomyces mangrovisoli TaxID=1428628 RepID=UPI0009A0F616|nr:ATP-binding protein [Streptomyces mangrovisoli]